MGLPVENFANTMKWQKYELLAKSGLTSLSYLQNNIFRYSKNNIDELINDICLYFASSNEPNILVVIKFVEHDKPGQLWNLRITKSPIKEELKALIIRHTIPQVVEYWFCGSKISKEIYNFSGRYLFDYQDFKIEVVEIVWWTSPRVLNGDISSNRFPYARYLKKFPSRFFTLGNKPNGSFKFTDIHLKNCLSMISALVHSKKTEIEIFQEILLKHNIRSYSLEFKFENGIGNFIDWDTSNDHFVLNLSKKYYPN